MDFSDSQIAAIIFFTISTKFTPGPNSILLISSALNFGFKKSLPLISGYCIGFSMMIFIIGLTLSNFLKAMPLLLTYLKYLGTAYFVYLALNMIFSSSSNSKLMPKPLSFLSSMLIQWLNTKAWLSCISISSIFILNTAHMLSNLVFLVIIYFIVTLLSAIFWSAGGYFLKKLISNQKILRVFNIAMAIILLLSISTFYI